MLIKLIFGEGNSFKRPMNCFIVVLVVVACFVIKMISNLLHLIAKAGLW